MTTRMVSLIFRPTGNRVPTRLSYPTRPSQNVLGCPSPPSVLGIFQVQPFWTNPWGTGKSGSSSQTSKHLSTSHNLQWKNLPKKTTEKCHVLASQEKKRLTKRMEFPHTRTFADDIRGCKRGICGFKSRLPHPNRHGHFFKKMKGFKSQKVSSAANRTALLNPRRSTLPRAACCPDIFFPLVNSMLPTQLQSKPRLYKGCCSCNFSDIFFCPWKTMIKRWTVL